MERFCPEDLRELCRNELLGEGGLRLEVRFWFRRRWPVAALEAERR